MTFGRVTVEVDMFAEVIMLGGGGVRVDGAFGSRISLRMADDDVFVNCIGVILLGSDGGVTISGPGGAIWN